MDTDLYQALDTLKSGGIILYPTDTVWGIGCDATNPQAVSRIYQLKRRSDSKSMIVLVDQPGRIPSYVDEVPEVAWELIELAENLKTHGLVIPWEKTSSPQSFAEEICRLFLKT